MWFWSKARRRQNIGFVFGLIFGLLSFAILFFPGQEYLTALGPANVGHEEVRCDSCHHQAPGSTLQQIRANARYTLGLRAEAVDFGYKDVGNAACLDCHIRLNDRHPTHRFLEPRFADARAAVAPHFCASCHVEHTGKRVNIEPTYCMHCHQDMVMENDPLPIAHQQLIADARWETCLGCHDFHGNYVMETETDVAKILTPKEISAYFDGGDFPLAEQKYYQARTEEE